MKRNTAISLFYGVLSVVLITSTLGSCRKKKDTIAVVHVYDANNQVVSGATVQLKGTSTIGEDDRVKAPKTAVTDANGNATFNCNDIYQLGQSGVAVYDIEVTFNSFSGSGIIKVEQETTSEENVFL